MPNISKEAKYNIIKKLSNGNIACMNILYELDTKNRFDLVEMLQKYNCYYGDDKITPFEIIETYNKIDKNIDALIQKFDKMLKISKFMRKEYEITEKSMIIGD